MRLFGMMKRIGVWMEGIPFKTAWFFGIWKGGGNISLLKQFEKKGGVIIFKPLGLELSVTSMFYFNHDLNLLADTCRLYYPIQQNGSLQLTGKALSYNINIRLSSYQSLFVFNEVFREQVYGFSLPTNCIVVDVGMNIGIASLYFAAHPFVQKVYAYELVTATYELAKINILLNPLLSSKIHTHQFGWGVTMGFYNLKAVESGSTDATIKNIQPIENPGRILEDWVEVQSAEMILNEILLNHPNESIVLKLDAEGMEYEILPILQNAGLLKRIHGIMLEWHNAGYESLLQDLSTAGFKCNYRPDQAFDGRLGMIYGWR